MIFLTIGSQEPFDRLICAMDKLAPQLNMLVVAQAFHYRRPVVNMQSFDFIAPLEFRNFFTKADVIVAHAGMGTIITALELRKPIIVMPRLFKYGETRNDHQLASAKKLEELAFVKVAYEEYDLKSKIQEAILEKRNHVPQLSDRASYSLLSAMKDFIQSE